MIVRWGLRAVDALVVGGGPVGMLATHRLIAHGLSVLAIDQRPDATQPRYSVVLHPASVARLAAAGFDPAPLGHAIERIAIHRGAERTAGCALADAGLGNAIALPQHRLQEAMDATLPIERGITMASIRVAPPASTATVTDDSGEARTVRARFVVGADGIHSRVRDAIGATFVDHGPADRFVLAELTGDVAFEGELRYGLDDRGVSAAWPLPDRRARINIAVGPDDEAPADDDAMRAFLRERAPWCAIDVERVDWATAATLENRLTDRFLAHGVAVAGDAAHSANPIPAMSLNLGLAEADAIADGIVARDLAAALRPFDGVAADLFGSAPDPQQRRLRASLPAFGDDAARLLSALG